MSANVTGGFRIWITTFTFFRAKLSLIYAFTNMDMRSVLPDIYLVRQRGITTFFTMFFPEQAPDGHEFQGAECKLSGSERTGIYDFSRTDHHLCGRYSGAMGIRLGGV